MKIDFLANHENFIPTVCDWFHKEWGYLNPNRTVDALMQQVRSRLNTEKAPSILIAYDGRGLLGTVTLRLDELPEQPDLFPWLSSLYVEESRRGSGAAKELIARCIELARQFSYGNIYLYTDKKNLRKWYEKLGWLYFKSMKHSDVEIDLLEYDLSLIE